MEHNALKRSGHVALAVLLALFSHPALAATIIVDETTCTLVQAITAANSDTAVGGCAAGSGADTIELTTDVTLTNINNSSFGQNGLPRVLSEITVEGTGFTILRDLDAPGFRLFFVLSTGTLTLNDMTLLNGGYLHTALNGGAIANLGILIVSNGTLLGNSAGSGGGIWNANNGVATLTNSTVSGNVADSGGGIDNRNGGHVTLTNSTVSGNSAGSGAGGGIANRDGGYVTLTNSTVSGNSAGSGGGIWNYDGSYVTLSNSTVSGNSAGSGGGIYNFNVFTITNSIVAANVGSNCANSVTDNGNNFANGGGCGNGFMDITPDVDFDTNLVYGGPTQTHPLLLGSVAIDAAGDCGLDTDQRGILRDDGACDSGSFEFRLCGNGILDPGEECDDQNNDLCDGCSADCTVEAACGDGILNETCEECDDGAETPTCDDDCTLPECGDGNLNTTAGEECDGGGETGTCDDDCTPPECGDGNHNVAAGEECDDGNNQHGDGCQGNCLLPICGDGILDPFEDCDDGNDDDGDGCACSDAYLYDSGVSTTSVGIGTSDVGQIANAWIHHFDRRAGAAVLTGVSTTFGTPVFPGGSQVMPGQAFQVHVWSDPNEDGHPSDAVLLASASGTVDAASIDTDVFQTLSVGPVALPPSFFIGAATRADFPAPLDQSISNGEAWFDFNGFFEYDPTLVAGAFNMDDIGIPGVWLLRGNAGVDVPTISQWGMITLIGLVLVASLLFMRRRGEA